ncbi:MAG: hypothetical protein KatS3mg096_838 [Candidatus Parcubacteria bacterium]|nr:MAG: hypothetical protein KatS3mg096_838 [Candidatus Parcubacteria bacterium]
MTAGNKIVIMCPPQYYQIEYEINPWMKTTNKINKKLVYRQYQTLKHIYQKLNLQIFEIEPQKHLPDMVFTANYGSFHKDKFIVSRFKYPQRQEEAEYAKIFIKQLGYEIIDLPTDAVFEGQGDLIATEEQIFCGYGFRTNRKAIKYLEKIYNKPIIGLKLKDPYYYHLDTCFSLLKKDTTMINKQAFTKESLNKIKNQFKKVIITNDQDNKSLACNNLIVNNTIIISADISSNLTNQLKLLKFKVIKVKMTEYLKGGGSIKCISLVS